MLTFPSPGAPNKIASFISLRALPTPPAERREAGEVFAHRIPL